MGPHGIGKIFGQEKNITTCNLARMNMLLHGVKDTVMRQMSRARSGTPLPGSSTTLARRGT